MKNRKKKTARYTNYYPFFFRPLVSVFLWLSNKVSYTFSVSLITAIGGFLIASYIATFIASTVQFQISNTSDDFLFLFGLLCIFEYAPGYFLHFGILEKWKIPSFTSSLRLINRFYRNGKINTKTEDKYLKELYRAVEKLPRSNMIAAGIYPSIVMIAVTVQELMIGTMQNAFFIFLGILSAIFIYTFYTYVIAELLTGEMRRRLKRMLVMRKISFGEKSYFSIRRKFIFISFLVFSSMIELGLMFYFQNSKDGFSILPWVFIGMTGVVVGSLLYFYLISIEEALLEIESAAVDLGRGGKGKLYGRSLDKEFIRMGKGIVSAAYEVNQIRNNLEKKVEERTVELERILTEVRKLKDQQDGDYFLISLLTDVLKEIFHTENIKSATIDYYLEEKKKFKFRKWTKDIGGDMIMAQSVTLRGRSYAMFLNADAMGKSIQGAGGVLVMGSVLKFLLEKTISQGSDKNRLYPERWLIDAYKELQKIFEGFNGSMLMSMVLGLLDTDSGLVYYINAEHPWVILFRDRKAEFIENELMFHKIGTEGVKIYPWVKLFQLMPHDSLILGSDGRDDILLGTDESGNRIINEDENLILKNIEKSDGEIRDLVYRIKETGEITDDLSLLKITYLPEKSSSDQSLKKEEKEAYQNAIQKIKEKKYQKAEQILEMLYNNNKENTQLLDLMMRNSLKMKNYPRTFHYAEKLLKINPGLSEPLYYASFAAKLNKNFKRAKDHGERLRLRDPENIKNIINLADTWRLSGNQERALYLVHEALAHDPGNAKAEYLKSKIQSIINTQKE